VDLESFFRSRIENMLIKASWFEEVKQDLQISGVSPVWGDGPPAWYIWIGPSPGVHELRLEDTFARNADGQELYSGLFAVKFYPFPHSTVFHDFSLEEQTFVQSSFFDDTNTPKFECYSNIPDLLFKVATLEFTIDAQRKQTLFKLESLDRIRTRFNKEVTVGSKLFNQKKGVRKGEIDRDVPGWDLGYHLYNRILGLYAYYSRTKPCRVIMTRETGFELVHDENERLRPCTTRDAKLDALTVIFRGKANSPELRCDTLIIEETKDVNKELIFDRSFPCGHTHELNSQSLSSLPLLNERWWSLAEADYKSGLASTCGCT
jgi:hypothetical protein